MKLGHVHLKVSDLDEAVEFYQDIFGFEVEERLSRYVFLQLNDEHHSLALQEVKGSRQSTRGRPGLYHVAYEVEEEKELKEIKERAQNFTSSIQPVDHGISRSLYFSDASGNGIEVYVDTRAETNQYQWQGRNAPLEL